MGHVRYYGSGLGDGRGQGRLQDRAGWGPCGCSECSKEGLVIGRCVASSSLFSDSLSRHRKKTTFALLGSDQERGSRCTFAKRTKQEHLYVTRGFCRSVPGHLSVNLFLTYFGPKKKCSGIFQPISRQEGILNRTQLYWLHSHWGCI